MSRGEDFCIKMPESRSSISKSTRAEWLIEGIVFVLSLGGLIASLTLHESENHVNWFLEPWKWCVLVMVIVGGRRILQLIMMFVVDWVKMMFLFLEIRACYSHYIYRLRKSVAVVLWFGLVLLTWFLLFKGSEVKRFFITAGSKLDSHFQKFITRSLTTLVIGGFLWVLKTLLVNILTPPFQARRLFDRIRESLIDRYILERFSAENCCSKREKSDVKKWIDDNHLPCEKEKEKMVIYRLKNIEAEEISAWTMNELTPVIKSPLSSITEALESAAKKELDVINLFEKADVAANDIFRNVHYASGKSNGGFQIEEDELQSLFAGQEEVSDVVQHIIGAEQKNQVISAKKKREKNPVIKKQALKKWLVNATTERRSLAQTLIDNERAIKELNKLVSVTLLILLFVLWLIMLGILTTEAFVAVMGQFLALAFIFGDTVKSVFQGIIFVFVKHPFDIGNCCLINGEEMVVEKMNLLSTIFRKDVKNKIVYPNSVLSGLHIKNLDKGDRHVVEDSFEISIDIFQETQPSPNEGQETQPSQNEVQETQQSQNEGQETQLSQNEGQETQQSQIEVQETQQPQIEGQGTQPSKFVGQETELPQIEALRQVIGDFLSANGDKWLPGHDLKFKEIEDQKLKIVLTVSYRKTDLKSDWARMISRRDALVKELTKFFAKEKGKIKCYNILPKAVDAE